MNIGANVVNSPSMKTMHVLITIEVGANLLLIGNMRIGKLDHLTLKAIYVI